MINLDAYQRDGYAVLDVLTPAEVAKYRPLADEAVRRWGNPQATSLNYVVFVMPGRVDPALAEMLDHPILVSAVEKILGGGPLAMDNATMLGAEAGYVYHQGWHRDVLQVPEEFINDSMFSPKWFHNNVQLNLALVEDTAFWAVPGSHARPDTPEERAAFAGTKHMSPVGAQMPGGRSMKLAPGQAILYNNNLIHRGWCDFTQPRRTFHIGYHNSQRQPTWHFYNFDDRTFPPDFLRSLPPALQRWMRGRLMQRLRFPDDKASFRSGLPGN